MTNTDPSSQVRGKIVGPPLEESDVAELDELAREEREDALVGEGDEALEDATVAIRAPKRAAGHATKAPSEPADGAEGAGEAPLDVALEEEAALTAERDAAGEFAAEGLEEPFADNAWEAEPNPVPYVLLRYVDVVMVLPSQNPVLILEEAALPGRELRIPIGLAEGVAISYAARKLQTPKPLTHELVIDLLESFALTIDAVRITEVEGASYRAELVCSGPPGRCTLACRPSDAVALALRQRLVAPILAAPEVLEIAGVAPELGN
ncbi:MAG: bifunctional nuclease family protein [Actinomycetota bacterium]|nr:bifunctional nuclease family protein [Actinomycetota bacterium]